MFGWLRVSPKHRGLVSFHLCTQQVCLVWLALGSGDILPMSQKEPGVLVTSRPSISEEVGAKPLAFPLLSQRNAGEAPRTMGS